MMWISRAMTVLSVALLLACGSASTPPAADADSEGSPATEAATEPAAAQSALTPAADAGPERPAGLPETAIAVTDGEGKVYWVDDRGEGRVALYEFLPDGQVSGTAGRIDQLLAVYPTLDLSPLIGRSAAAESAIDHAGADNTDPARDRTGSSLDALRANRDALVEVTPGAKQAIEMARRGTVLDLTGPTLKHMIERMGSRLAMTDEEMQALLAESDGRFTATQAELRKLLKEAGPEGVTREQLAALMPLTLAAEAPKIDRDAPGKGRVKDDCPGLVYGRGDREVCLPLGELSFADAAVSFAAGSKASKPPFDFPGSALGEPDYRNTHSADFISLGCDGVLVVQFTDNILVDVDGVDLYIFEIGPVVERTELAISADGSDWVEVGVIEGARSDVDIGPFVQKGQRFPFVRLKNASRSCGGNHAGADIDAIAAVGAEIRLSLDSALLFDVGKFDIKPEAEQALMALAGQLEAYGSDIRVTVEGHTDSTGSDSANRTLSEARASAVWSYLAKHIAPLPSDVTIQGHGESRPVADNETEDGRARNRRVDILILPGRNGYLKE